MSVIGLYLPCLDLGIDCYREHMKELERFISESCLLGPVTMLGDFVAYLGGWECQQNMQGVLLQEMMERSKLGAVSEGMLSSGPGYTYCSGDVKTTVDYILMDIEAASMASYYRTDPMEDLNTSDHLLLTVSLSYDAWSDSSSGKSTGSFKMIDWVGAEKNGDLAAFSTKITSRLEPMYSRVYDDAESISGEIDPVASILKETADRLLSCIEHRGKKKWRDVFLSCFCICIKSRQARMAWRSAGCQSEGPLFDEKSRLRSAVRKRRE